MAFGRSLSGTRERMSKKYDLKAIFGDWEKSNIPPPTPTNDTQMTDEIAITDMPVDFALGSFMMLLRHEARELGFALPESVSLSYFFDDEATSAFQIVFKHAIATENMLPMVDDCIEDVLSHMKLEPSHNGFFIEVSHEGNYDEAEAYINRNIPPGSPDLRP